MTATSTSTLRLLILASPTTTTKAIPIPSPFPPLLEYLTETSPLESLSTFAGYTSHPPLHLRTKYYDTHVMIWCDELPPHAAHANNPPVELDTINDSIPSHSVEPLPTTDDTADADSSSPSPAADLAQWQSQMLSPSAFEVRSVIGGIILILPITPQQVLLRASSTKPEGEFAEYIQAVHSLRETIEDESGTARDVAGLVVLQLTTTSPEPKISNRLKELSEELETWCHAEGIFGLDFVSWNGIVRPSSEGSEGGGDSGEDTLTEKNEYGEKVGIHRVREVLEGVDWTANPATTENDADDFLGEEGAGLDIFSTDKFNSLDSELQQEMMGLKLSMLDFKPSDGNKNDDDGEDMSPSQMQDLMERVVAIRDAGADLPKEERQVFAKREVEKIIRELIDVPVDRVGSDFR
ncbi:hypothetical protein DV736_g4300, partial [Chaetothyriales sp. CBS 134916]